MISTVTRAPDAGINFPRAGGKASLADGLQLGLGRLPLGAVGFVLAVKHGRLSRMREMCQQTFG